MKLKKIYIKVIRKIKSLFTKQVKYNGVKNILIFGAVRTGKTSLAEKCHKRLGYSLLDSDLIVNAFDKVFPETGITNGGERTNEAFAPFLYRILDGLTSNLETNVTVLPISQTSLKILNSYKNLAFFHVIVLGFSSICVEEMYKKLIENEKESDWTKMWDNRRKKELCEYIIKQSKENEKSCKRYGFYYFDMSEDLPLIQDKIVEFIKEINSHKKIA